MHEILQIGIDEGVSFGGEIKKIINRMDLLFGDSKDILPKLSPEVIMIDTMYKDRKKTALVKNNMRLVGSTSWAKGTLPGDVYQYG